MKSFLKNIVKCIVLFTDFKELVSGMNLKSYCQIFKEKEF